MSIEKKKHLENLWSKFEQDHCEDAYYEVYSYFHHYLGILGVKRGFATDVVYDTINDVFLSLWENRVKNNKIIALHNYIVTVFIRRLYRNDKDFSGTLDISIIAEQMEVFNVPSREDILVQGQLDNFVERLVKNKIDGLSDRQRLVIYQKFYLGLSYDQIAKANGQSINTVYNTIYQSVEKLRKMLSAEEEAFLKIAVGALSTFFLFFF